MTQPSYAGFETMVREYTGKGALDDFQRDAAALGVQGWRVMTQVERNPRAGCLRVMFLGLLALVWRPRPTIVVTYQRQLAEPPPPAPAPPAP